MTSESSSHTIEPEQQHQAEHVEDKDTLVVASSGVFSRFWQFWPFRVMKRAFRGVWWLFGFSSKDEAITSATETTPPRQWLAGRKRLRWVTRVLLSVLPRRMQSSLGYPVCTSIGRSLSPEVSISPTKPCGKGSKRKQDEADEDDEEGDEEQEPNQTWVETLLNEELAEEDSVEDPNYQPSVEETDSEEYCLHNGTESDIEAEIGPQTKTEDQPATQ